MTFRERDYVFPGPRRFFAGACILVALQVSACGTATIEDAVPQSVAQSSSGTIPTDTGPGPTDTGEFPNLNIPRRGETEQLTPAERAAKAAELAAARRQAKQGQTASADIEQLRRLGSTHTQEALKQIEEE